MNLIRTRCRRNVFSIAAMAIIVLAFNTIPVGRSAFAAAPTTQVIFSGVGITNDGLHTIAFSISCQPDGNSPNHTGACKGSIHAEGEDNAVGVSGFIVENPDGTYVARVFSNKDNFLLAAAFHNVDPEPEPGPNNVVQFGVLTSGGSNPVGVATDAIVNVTGPGN